MTNFDLDLVAELADDLLVVEELPDGAALGASCLASVTTVSTFSTLTTFATFGTATECMGTAATTMCGPCAG